MRESNWVVMEKTYVKSKAKRWYRRGMNTIKNRQQNHMCQGGRSVLNIKLRVTMDIFWED
jgi:hypothetical protein